MDWQTIMRRISLTGYKGAAALEPMNWDYQNLSMRQFLDLAFQRVKKIDSECMELCLDTETEYGWYLCFDEDRIIGGLGVIENDFHDRKDLTPNVCAVYTEEEYRCKGVAGHLLNMVVDDLKSKAITPIYLLTDHTGFYERYGWEFLCLVQGNDEP